MENIQVLWFYLLFGVFFIIICLSYELTNCKKWLLITVIISYLVLPFVIYFTKIDNRIAISLWFFIVSLLIFVFVFEKYHQSEEQVELLIILLIVILLIFYLWYFWNRKPIIYLRYAYVMVVLLLIMWSLAICQMIVNNNR